MVVGEEVDSWQDKLDSKYPVFVTLGLLIHLN